MDGKESLANVENLKDLMTSPLPPFAGQPIVAGKTPWNGPKFRNNLCDPPKVGPFQTQTMNKDEGVKADNGKPRVDLLDAGFLLEVGEVLGHGAEKYADHNWRLGLSVSRIIGAILRHLFAIMRGEDIDRDSGASHCAHIGCEVMFLHWTLKHRPDKDDRCKD